MLTKFLPLALKLHCLFRIEPIRPPDFIHSSRHAGANPSGDAPSAIPQPRLKGPRHCCAARCKEQHCGRSDEQRCAVCWVLHPADKCKKTYVLPLFILTQHAVPATGKVCLQTCLHLSKRSYTLRHAVKSTHCELFLILRICEVQIITAVIPLMLIGTGAQAPSAGPCQRS